MTAVAVSKSFPASPRLRGSYLKDLMRPLERFDASTAFPLSTESTSSCSLWCFYLSGHQSFRLTRSKRAKDFSLCFVCVEFHGLTLQIEGLPGLNEHADTGHLIVLAGIKQRFTLN